MEMGSLINLLLGRILHYNCERLKFPARKKIVSDIEVKRIVTSNVHNIWKIFGPPVLIFLLTSFVSSNQLAIKTDLSLVVHSLEDQLYPPVPPGLVNLELPPVDHLLSLRHGSHHPRQGGFYTERYPDLLS